MDLDSELSFMGNKAMDQIRKTASEGEGREYRTVNSSQKGSEFCPSFWPSGWLEALGDHQMAEG